MSTKPLQPPKHVNLRTQQRRLRHLKGVSVRNLTSPEPVLWDPLSVAVWFTIHDPKELSTVYTSSVIQETYNPSWGSLLFTYDNAGSFTILNSFVLRVWLKSSGEQSLCFQKDVNLSDYLFMGYSTIRKDGSGFLPNTVIVNMFEGFYVSQEVGGFVAPPPLTSFHQLQEVLPPKSLLEVRKSEVYDSYLMKDLNKMCAHQHRLDRLRASVALDVRKIKKMRVEYFEMTMKRLVQSKVKARVARLKEQLEQQRAIHENEMKAVAAKKEALDLRECCLNQDKAILKENQVRFQSEQQHHFKKRDQLGKTLRKLHLRQRAMIAELAETFCIKQVDESHTICDVILPNGDPSDGATPEQVGVGLGFVAQLVHYLAKFLLIPLEYPVKPYGSRSSITDSIHEEGSVERELPLYIKGVERVLYQMGLYLLWRDILQLRQHSGYSTNKTNAKKILPCLKSLIDNLVKDKYSVLPLCEQSVATSSTNSVYSVGSASSHTVSCSSLPAFPITSTGPASPRPPTLPPLSSHPEHRSPGETGHSDGKHSASNLAIKHLMDSQSENRKLSPPVKLYKRWPRSPQKEFAQNVYDDITMVDADNGSPRYSLSVAVPLSDTDTVVLNLPVEESLPASLPFTSFIPSESNPSPDHSLSSRNIEIEVVEGQGNDDLGRINTDVSSEHRQGLSLLQSNDILEGETNAVRPAGTYWSSSATDSLFQQCDQENSSATHTNIHPEMSLFGSGEYIPGEDH